ncbi:MAG: hypothetical protein HGN29_14730 [Asgard group archaeon]|nr:hypothetical protein [Asgard group archaeon]
MVKKALIGVIIVLVLAGGGYAAYHFWPTETFSFEMTFNYEVNGIYGENATYESGYWSFDPISMSSVNATTQSSEVTNKGLQVTIQLKNEYCLAFTDFWCKATTDADIRQIIVTLYQGDLRIYSTENSNSEIFAFDYNHFFDNLTVIVDVQLD